METFCFKQTKHCIVLKTFSTSCFLLLLIASFSISAQKSKAQLWYVNGKHKVGYAELVRPAESYDNSMGTEGFVKFREDKNGRPISIKYSDLSRVTILKGKKVETYEFLKVLGEGRVKALKLELKGKTSLYTYKIDGISSSMGAGPNSTVLRGGTSKQFCVRTEGEEMAFKLTQNPTFSNNFRDAAMFYFKDCPDLVALVQKRKFKKSNVEELVVYYNKYCQN